MTDNGILPDNRDTFRVVDEDARPTSNRVVAFSLSVLGLAIAGLVAYIYFANPRPEKVAPQPKPSPRSVVFTSEQVANTTAFVVADLMSVGAPEQAIASRIASIHSKDCTGEVLRGYVPRPGPKRIEHLRARFKAWDYLRKKWDAVADATIQMAVPTRTKKDGQYIAIEAVSVLVGVTCPGR